MPYFAVSSGNIFQCVEADDPLSACVEAVKLHFEGDSEEECLPGLVFQTAEPGQLSGDHMWVLSENVQKAGGFLDRINPEETGDTDE